MSPQPVVRIGTRASKLALAQSRMMQLRIATALGAPDRADEVAPLVQITTTGDRIQDRRLLEVGGKALMDHMLDRLAAVGVEMAVVNVHYFADLMEAHLKARTAAPRIVVSDERAQALETGGGVKHALPLLPDEAFFVANIDAIWLDGETGAIEQVVDLWDPARMDVCLMLAPTSTSMGFHDSGDVFLEADGRVRFNQPGEPAPFAHA
eukprot:gene20840-20764_t